MIDVKTRIILQKASNILALLLLLCACDGTRFHSFSSLDGVWERDSAVTYSYANRYSPSEFCGLQIEARTDASYCYKNLVVCADFFNLSDSLLASDTLIVPVYGDDGRRIGATAGMLYQQKSNVVPQSISFRDSVTIRLYHLMPDTALKGVYDVGVRLVKLD
jgi:gliding motility-associated lipoprotein GldH